MRGSKRSAIRKERGTRVVKAIKPRRVKGAAGASPQILGDGHSPAERIFLLLPALNAIIGC